MATVHGATKGSAHALGGLWRRIQGWWLDPCLQSAHARKVARVYLVRTVRHQVGIECGASSQMHVRSGQL